MSRTCTLGFRFWHFLYPRFRLIDQIFYKIKKKIFLKVELLQHLQRLKIQQTEFAFLKAFLLLQPDILGINDNSKNM